jgi:hypothetical protein
MILQNNGLLTLSSLPLNSTLVIQNIGKTIFNNSECLFNLDNELFFSQPVVPIKLINEFVLIDQIKFASTPSQDRMNLDKIRVAYNYIADCRQNCSVMLVWGKDVVSGVCSNLDRFHSKMEEKCCRRESFVLLPYIKDGSVSKYHCYDLFDQAYCV